MGINFLIVEAVTINWQLSERTWVQFLAATGHRHTYRQNTHTQKMEKLKLVGGEGRTCFFQHLLAVLPFSRFLDSDEILWKSMQDMR